MGGELNTSSAEESQTGLRRESDLDAQAGLTTYVAAPIFNAVAYPPKLSFSKVEALEREAALIQRQPSHIAFVGNEPDDPETKKQRDKESEDRADFQMGMILQEQQREREREEWARTRSTVGGVTMTGEEWFELSKRMHSDDDLHMRVMAAFMGRGMSETEAEARYERVAEVAEAMTVPSSQRTEEQNAAIKKADADPTFKKDAETVSALMDKKPDLTDRSEFNDTFTQASSSAAQVSAEPVAPTMTMPITEVKGHAI